MAAKPAIFGHAFGLGREVTGLTIAPNAPMSGATARSAEASAPLAGWAAQPQTPLSFVWPRISIGRLIFPRCHCYGLRRLAASLEPGRHLVSGHAPPINNWCPRRVGVFVVWHRSLGCLFFNGSGVLVPGSFQSWVADPLGARGPAASKPKTMFPM